MRQFMVTITALTAFGAMMATANADANHGGPIRNGNQCFKYFPRKAGRCSVWLLDRVPAGGKHKYSCNRSVHSSQSGRIAVMAPSPAYETFSVWSF
jgi:hypothetical protein